MRTIKYARTERARAAASGCVAANFDELASILSDRGLRRAASSQPVREHSIGRSCAPLPINGVLLCNNFHLFSRDRASTGVGST
jgi:hypothetical protein